MRGKPILQWMLFVALWLLLILPIQRVTRSAVPEKPAEAMASNTSNVWLSVRFSSRPASFSIRQGDTDLLADSNPGTQLFDREVPMEFDEYGAELRLIAELPDGESAVEVVIETDGRARRSRTVWVSGSVDEVIPFTWGRDE